MANQTIESLIENISSEEFIKLFDFGTDGKYVPDNETKKLTDTELLKELGL